MMKLKRSIALLVAVLTFTMLFTGFTAVDAKGAALGYYDEEQPFDDGVYSIKVKNSDLYLDVIGGCDYNGASLHLWSLNYRNNQLWRLMYLGDGEYVILNMMSNRSLEVQNSYNYNGAKVQLWTYGGLACQRWRFEPVLDKYGYHDGSYKLVNVNSDKCLDIEGSRQVMGAKFHSWQNVDVPSQKFVMIKRY